MIPPSEPKKTRSEDESNATMSCFPSWLMSPAGKAVRIQVAPTPVGRWIAEQAVWPDTGGDRATLDEIEQAHRHKYRLP